MAWIRTPDRSVIVSESVSVGVAAYRSEVAPVQPKMRSAMSRAFQRPRAPAQAVQERGQRGAGFGAAVEALPAQPQLADQRIALVDRDQVDLKVVRGGLRRSLPLANAAFLPGTVH